MGGSSDSGWNLDGESLALVVEVGESDTDPETENLIRLAILKINDEAHGVDFRSYFIEIPVQKC